MTQQVKQEDLKELIKYEYAKCAGDMVYFFKKYVYIQHPIKGRIKFNLYHFQERVLQEIVKNRYNLILKSRQLGISTLSAGYALHLMLFNTDKNVLAVATKQETAKNLITKVRFMFKNLPSWLKCGVLEDNKLSLRLSNGSQIKAVSSSSDSTRSESVSLLIVDEAAFIDGIEDIWASAQQTLTTGGGAIVLSTPNGVGNFFHEQWEKASAKLGDANESRFNPIRLHWSMHPERDQKWRDEQDKLLGKRLAAQECDADFLSSGMTVVQMEDILYYEKNTVTDPVDERGIGKSLWVWKQPEPGRQYIVAADVARGDASDKSTFHVFDVESMEQVAEFRGLIDTKSFGDMLVSIGTEYNDALVVVENSIIGWAVLQQIIDRGYKNLYYTQQNLKYVDPTKQASNRINHLEKKSVAGFSMSVSTRPLIIQKIEEYCREKSISIRSKRLISELKVFVWKNGKAQAMTDKYNDDLVMAFGILLWIRDTSMDLFKQVTNLHRAMLTGVTKSPNPYTSVITTNNTNTFVDPWTMRVNELDEEDLKQWL
jgi:uncharacterized protein YifN (PemK superfamily)